MRTTTAQQFNNPVKVTLTSGGNTLDVLVLSVNDEVDPQNSPCHYELVVQGDSLPAWVDTGCWYHFDGFKNRNNVAQSGAWVGTTTQPGNITVFNLEPRAYLTPEMAGWLLRPGLLPIPDPR